MKISKKNREKFQFYNPILTTKFGWTYFRSLISPDFTVRDLDFGFLCVFREGEGIRLLKKFLVWRLRPAAVEKLKGKRRN